MRKITSREKHEKKSRRNQLIIGIVLIGIMISGTVGYSFLSKNASDTEYNKISYNGFEFIEKEGFWYVQIEDSLFLFRFNPRQTEIDNMNTSIIKKIDGYYNKPLYIYSEYIDAEYEIYRNMNDFVQRIQMACLNKKECADESYPIKTCEDNFIIISESDSEIPSIIQEDNCIFIRGKNEELTKLSDEFLFKILGIK